MYHPDRQTPPTCMEESQMSPGLLLQPRPQLPQFHQLSYNVDDDVELTMSSSPNYPLVLPNYAPLLTWDLTHTTTFTASINQSSRKRLRTLGFRDHVWSYKQKLRAFEPDEVTDEEKEDGSSNGGMRLVQLLIWCAEAVACRDRSQASTLLCELSAASLSLGDPFQRVASCFVRGLTDRLELLRPLGAAAGITTTAALSTERRAALALAYELCPYIRFAHLVANAAVLEAFEGESLVHVVDLGMTMGLPRAHQWRELVRGLAVRTGSRPARVRITGVIGPEADGATGAGLEAYARDLGVNLVFRTVTGGLEELKLEDFGIEEGEAVAVSSVMQLHCAVKESRGALNSVLRTIRSLSPRVVAVAEQDSGHNGPFFLGRFMEALHYYSAVFDSMEARMARYDTRRARMEQFFYGEEIGNIVSCEGPARVERHERVDQWRRRMSRAGFQPSPVKMTVRAKEWLEAEDGGGEGYTLAEEKGCLVLGWKAKPIIAASCWKC